MRPVLSGSAGYKEKGRNRRDGTQLTRTHLIFCPSQHLERVCKCIVFTITIPRAATCMDVHSSLASFEATLLENKCLNASRDPAVSLLWLSCRNSPHNRVPYRGFPKQIQYSSSGLQSPFSKFPPPPPKYSIAHNPHYCSPTWQL